MLPKNESNKEDKYYLFAFNNLGGDILEFSVDIFIDFKNESKFFLQKNKYIRGAFNLFNERKIQNKTFYIRLEDEGEGKTNDIYILEFSSNFKNIKPIFNNDFNYFDIIFLPNYIIKFYKEDNNLDYILEKKLYAKELKMKKYLNIIFLLRVIKNIII